MKAHLSTVFPCPHCGEEFELSFLVIHDGNPEIIQRTFDYECPECCKTFSITTGKDDHSLN